ncbi:hypothetical protein GCM10023063_22520 [Arthrobacter methylotrophus]
MQMGLPSDLLDPARKLGQTAGIGQEGCPEPAWSVVVTVDHNVSKVLFKGRDAAACCRLGNPDPGSGDSETSRVANVHERFAGGEEIHLHILTGVTDGARMRNVHDRMPF